MTKEDIISILSSFSGCTFAALSAETSPRPGIRKITSGEGIILFTNKSGSGYERMVRRRLTQIGKDPASFSVGPLPWGERIPDTPLIVKTGRDGADHLYLQTIIIRDGVSSYRVASTGEVILPADYRTFGINPPQPPSQGLPDDKVVRVRTYSLPSITEIKLLGRTLSLRLPS